MRRRQRKRVALPPRGVAEQTWKRGEAWSRDFQGLHARCARRWPPLPHAHHHGSGDAGPRPARRIPIPMARPSRSPSTTDPSSRGRSWMLGPMRMASRWISSSPANRRRTPTSRASTARSVMSARICSGLAASPTPARLSTSGRRTTTPSGRIAPCSSRLQRSMPSH